MTEHHDDPTLPFPALRPNPHHLMLLVRAAMVDDGHGGPWLALLRTHTPQGTPVYTHHIHTHPVDEHSTRRLVLLSGDEVLSYAHQHQWDSLTNPTQMQLRMLGTYACDLRAAALWDARYVEWATTYNAAENRLVRAEFAARCRSDARALRWREAERWLSRTEA